MDCDTHIYTHHSHSTEDNEVAERQHSISNNKRLGTCIGGMSEAFIVVTNN